MRVGPDLEVAAVLALVAVRVHVADDRVLDLADRVLEQRDRPDADHLVDRRRERDRRAGHRPDARAPHAAGDDDDVRLEVALVGPDAGHAAVLDIDAGHLGHRREAQGAHRLGTLAHDRPRAERVDHADARESRSRRG